MVGKSRRYWEACAALYGKQTDLPIGLCGSEKKVALKQNLEVPYEDYEQIVAATWLDKNKILFFHVPNGGFRRQEEAFKFQRMGVKPGVPDIVIPLARKGYHGLYIELKRVSGGRLSDAQRWWGDYLTKEGYLWRVAKGASELKAIVTEYLR